MGWSTRESAFSCDETSVATNVYALVIGIDKYKSRDIDDLYGAVSDADDVYKYLHTDLSVPTHHIVNLRNEEATRDAIIREIKAFSSRVGIRKGDAIVIYYAGHGTTAIAPPEWHSGNGRVSLIVPYDADKKLQTVGPLSQHSIPDRTIGALLHHLAEAGCGGGMGNNITVIFDCCHSGSGTRGFASPDIPDPHRRRQRGFALEGALSATLDADVMRAVKRVRDINVLEGFTHAGAKSHVLLAACRENESAFENDGRGYFTRELLKALRAVKPHETTYQELMRRLEYIQGQTPQCEGHYADRVLFGLRVPGKHKVYLAKPIGSGKFVVYAGLLNGVAIDARFSIYTDSAFKVEDPPMATLRTVKVHAFSSELTACNPRSIMSKELQLNNASRYFAVPQTHLERTNAFRSYVASALDPGNFQGFKEIAKDLACTPKADGSKASSAIGSGKVIATIRDVVSTTQDLLALHGQKTKTREAHAMENAISRFDNQLCQAPDHSFLRKKIDVEILQLKRDMIGPEEGVCWMAQGPNLYDQESGIAHLRAQDGTPYGILLRNHFAVPLHVWAFYFDDSTLAITEYYRPPATGCNAEGVLPGSCDHLQPGCGHPEDVRLKGETKGELTIGYGAGGGQPCEFVLRRHVDEGLGYIKLFLSTQPIDLLDFEQASPFQSVKTRHPTQPKRDAMPLWDTITIIVKQCRNQP